MIPCSLFNVFLCELYWIFEHSRTARTYIRICIKTILTRFVAAYPTFKLSFKFFFCNWFVHFDCPHLLPPHIGHFPPVPAFQKKYIIPGTKKKINRIINTHKLTPLVVDTNCSQLLQYLRVMIFLHFQLFFYCFFYKFRFAVTFLRNFN